MKNSFVYMCIFLSLFILSSTNVNAQFLEDTETVDIVQIPGFDDGSNIPQYYVSDLGTETTDSIAWAVETGDVTKWYKIPAGSVSDGTTDVQAYYYKNVATGRYLYISDEILSLLAEDDGDWPTQKAEAGEVNEKTAAFKWFDRAANPDWPWAVHITNASGINLEKREGNRYNSLTGVILMKVNESGGTIDPTIEFFGVYVPNVSVGGFAGGLGNVWIVLKAPVVVETGVTNPDIPHFMENTRTVNVVQITTWMDPNNAALNGEKPYASDSEGIVVYSSDAAVDDTKWYEIPVGGNEFGVQMYAYKNVATGAYLQGSSDTLSKEEDWLVSEATTSATNDGSNLYKWSKMDSNWGNGPWLVNEEGNTGTRPAGDNVKAFFAFTMLTANSEFFGVDVPNVAISNVHDGGNAWTAVQINVVESATNPDYQSDGSLAYSIDALNFFATDDGEDSLAASYDEVMHTITYSNGGWHRAGWNWEAEGGLDVSAYNQVWIKFDASALPKTGDGDDGSTKLQFDVVYMDDSKAADFDNKSNEIRSNATEYFYNLTPGKKIKRITLKSEAEGDVVLTDAFLFSKGIDPVDLIVTTISWSPQDPVLGDSIMFSATIKNQSEFASPDVKHGVIFGIKLPGTDGNGTLIGWSDTHLTSLAPGDSVTVTINGGPNDGDGKWRPGAARTFTVVALVNDQKDVLESDYNNNTMEMDIVIANPLVDIIVTNISWTPEEPVLGDEILLSVTIKNQSEFTSPNVKHGVAFSIGGTVIAWSDTHLTGLVPGEEVTLTANGDPNGGDGKWSPALSKTFTVKAEVNDQHDIDESDFDNNTLEADIFVDENSGIDEMVLEGKVFVKDGNVYVTNFPESAVVSIYNLQAQKIGDFSPNEVSQLTLQNNLYVLKIVDGGRISNHKVMIK